MGEGESRLGGLAPVAGRIQPRPRKQVPGLRSWLPPTFGKPKAPPLQTIHKSDCMRFFRDETSRAKRPLRGSWEGWCDKPACLKHPANDPGPSHRSPFRLPTPIRPKFAVNKWLGSFGICFVRYRSSHPAGCVFTQAAPSAPGAPVLWLKNVFASPLPSGRTLAGCAFAQAAPSTPSAPVLW